MSKQISRRNVLKSLFAMGILSVTNSNSYSWTLPNIKQLTQDSPFKKLSMIEIEQSEFSGDQIDENHQALWNLEEFVQQKGGWPIPTDKQNLVIVGGGISGLLNAYFHINKKPLILELDQQFGGNSKGEIINHQNFSVGAAYVTIPEPNSNIDLLFKELQLHSELKLESDSDVQFIFKQKILKDFWQGTTDPEAHVQFTQIHTFLKYLSENQYPDIPWTNESQITYQEFLELDQINFKKWLLNKFPQIHPHILEYFQMYAWSSFTASIEEVSALQMLNFILSEVDGILALPGGNAMIADRLYDYLKKKIGPSHLKSRALVLRVLIQDDYCYTTYIDDKGQLYCIQSDHVILSCQKMIARRICPQMPTEQSRAIQNISYRGYVVGNFMFDQKIKPLGFDIYCLHGRYPEQPMAMKQSEFKITDFVFADWANPDSESSNMTILTAYAPLPFDGARQFLFNPNSYSKYKKLMTEEISTYANLIGLNMNQLKSVRLQRWGHSLPVAKTNFFSSGEYGKINQPIMQKIFFSNQDNYLNPAFESAFAAAESTYENFINS